MSKTTLIPIRTFDFEGGLLHLDRAVCQTMTDAEVGEHYAHKGALLSAHDDEMEESKFYSLTDFNDL